MLSIKVLGPGCLNCERLALHAAQAVERWEIEHPELEITIEKVTEPEKFLEYGLLSSPGLVINEKLVSSGRIPAPSHIVAWLEEATAR